MVIILVGIKIVKMLYDYDYVDRNTNGHSTMLYENGQNYINKAF